MHEYKEGEGVEHGQCPGQAEKAQEAQEVEDDAGGVGVDTRDAQENNLGEGWGGGERGRGGGKLRGGGGGMCTKGLGGVCAGKHVGGKHVQAWAGMYIMYIMFT